MEKADDYLLYLNMSEKTITLDYNANCTEKLLEENQAEFIQLQLIIILYGMEKLSFIIPTSVVKVQ